MAKALARGDERKAFTAPASAGRAVRQNEFARRQRNRILAIALGCIAAFVFSIVMSLAVLLRYAEAHHWLSLL